MSVSGAIVHPKFPDAVVYESVAAEKPYVQLAALDDDVIDILAQPPKLTIRGQDRRGRVSHRHYTPDYIEFHTSCFSIVEAKREAELEELAANGPDWTKDSSGDWHFLPAKTVALKMGMGFRVFNPDAFSKPYIANLDALSRIPRTPLGTSDQLLIKRAAREVSYRPRTIRELCAAISGIDGELILRAILEGKLFGETRSQLIDPNFLVYKSFEDAPSAKRNLTGTNEGFLSGGAMQRRLDAASKSEVEAAASAQSRYDERRRVGAPLNSTDYRFKARLARAESEGSMRLSAFIPDYRSRGGAGRPIATAVRSAIVTHTGKVLAQGRYTKHSKLYADFVCEANANGLDVPSLETHRRIVTSEFSGERVGFQIGGKRGFHEARARVDGKDVNPRLDIGGLHVHIDGYQADVRSVSDDGVDRGRLMLYPLVDDMSGYVLGLGAKLGSTSTLGVMSAFRDCIDRNGGLPSAIHHDWGPEFINHAIESSTARLGVSLSRRPPSAARFGGKGEMFHEQLSKFLGSLPGSTLPDQKGRAVDASKKSRATAALSIEEIVRSISEWTFEIWNKSVIGSHTRSPEELWQESIRNFPMGIVRQANCMTMLFNTSFPVAAKKADSRGSISLGTQKFTATELCNVLRSGDLPSEYRLDSKNPSILYAWTARGPIELRAQSFHESSGASPGRRLCMFADMLTSKSRAKKHQIERNVSEAQLLRRIQGPKTHPLVEMDDGSLTEESAKQARRDFSRAINANPRTFKLID